MSESPTSRRRILALVAVVVGVVVAARVTGVSRQLDATTLQATMRAAGPLGALVFVGAFTLGVLAYLPGAIFVAAGTLAYGPVGGYLLNLLAGVVSICASFGVARAIGGQPMAEPRRAWLRRLLARIDERPVLWLAVLRTVVFISPPLNTALALSRIRFRDFALGSALGLVVPMAVVTFALDWFVQLPAFGRLMRLVLG